VFDLVVELQLYIPPPKGEHWVNIRSVSDLADYVVIELSVHECPSVSKTASVGSGSGVGAVQSEATRCATGATMGSTTSSIVLLTSYLRSAMV
jgi:hypothetical protein